MTTQKHAPRLGTQFHAQAVHATVTLIRNLYLADAGGRLSMTRDREQRTLWSQLGVTLALRDAAVKVLVEEGEMCITYHKGRLYACRTSPS